MLLHVYECVWEMVSGRKDVHVPHLQMEVREQSWVFFLSFHHVFTFLFTAVQAKLAGPWSFRDPLSAFSSIHRRVEIQYACYSAWINASSAVQTQILVLAHRTCTPWTISQPSNFVYANPWIISLYSAFNIFSRKTVEWWMALQS